MYIALLALAITTVFGARPVKVSVKNCSRNTDEGQIQTLDVSPTNGIVVGQNFTIAGDGIAQVDIPDGYFNATAKWEGVPITVTAQVHESAPDATVYITLTTTDTSTKDEIICVDIVVDIGKLAEEE